jgi:hypothetical protein
MRFVVPVRPRHRRRSVPVPTVPRADSGQVTRWDSLTADFRRGARWTASDAGCGFPRCAAVDHRASPRVSPFTPERVRTAGVGTGERYLRPIAPPLRVLRIPDHYQAYEQDDDEPVSSRRSQRPSPVTTPLIRPQAGWRKPMQSPKVSTRTHTGRACSGPRRLCLR